MLRDERDPKVPSSLVERPEFIAACATHDMSTVFALAKKYAGLSTSAIARMTAMKTDNVRAVLNSGRLIEDFAVYERIADGLGIPGEMLGLASRTWEKVAQPPFDPDTGGTSSAGIIVPSGTTNLVDMQRLEILRQSLQRTLSEGAVAPTSLDDWEQTVFRYGASTRDKAPSLMIYDLASDLDELNRALTACRTSVALQRLTRVTAQMTGLMVLSLVKLDDRAAFRRWARTARIAAAESGDPQTQAWVLVQEAYGHYYCDDFEEAAHVAQHTQSLTNVPCVGTALAAALEARAHAAIGEHSETVRALDQAETILSDLSPDETISSAFGYSESQLRFHAGSAFTHLGDTANASIAHDRALELIPEADYTDLAFVHIDRATCLAQDGDALGAAEYLTQTLTPLSEEQRRGIISLRARDVVHALPAGEQRRPEVTDLIDLLSADNPETGV
jgi:tetratricopeptide (TPR) repeat protein